MNVEWHQIPNFRNYEASKDGLIRTHNWKNTGKTRIMKPAYDNCGYLRTVLIDDDGRYCTVKVHRIIASTFIDNAENKETVNHKNGIKDAKHGDIFRLITN